MVTDRGVTIVTVPLAVNSSVNVRKAVLTQVLAVPIRDRKGLALAKHDRPVARIPTIAMTAVPLMVQAPVGTVPRKRPRYSPSGGR